MWEDEEESAQKTHDEILYGHVDTALSEQILAANKIVEEVIKEEVSDIDSKLVNNLTEVVAEIIENSKVEKHVSSENGTGYGSSSSNGLVCSLVLIFVGVVIF